MAVFPKQCVNVLVEEFAAAVGAELLDFEAGERLVLEEPATDTGDAMSGATR